MTSSTENRGTSVEFVQISADQAGQRIDNFLMTYLKGVPKSLVYRIVRKGEVRVNKGRIKPIYRLQEGDTVRIPPVHRSEKERPANASGKSLTALSDSILYEDKRILILNKPSGMAVHGGSGVSYGVIEALRQLRPDDHYLELVHRLDRETSGCLVIAKKRSALRQLHGLLREGDMRKRYIALVKGHWQGGEKRVAAPLHKFTLQSGERMVKVSEQGKPALSVFRPIATSKLASLVEVELHTGRTHQIRVHAASIGYPIAGDGKYGDREFNNKMKKQGLNRLFLHARSLEFTLTEPHSEIAVNAPFDDELEQVLRKLNINV
jgi:23S rRNA pseudouridine955/2504/2580 synthase